jgi:hypothetical protein
VVIIYNRQCVYRNTKIESSGGTDPIHPHFQIDNQQKNLINCQPPGLHPFHAAAHSFLWRKECFVDFCAFSHALLSNPALRRRQSTVRRWAETLSKPDWVELVAEVSKSALADATVAGGFGPALLKFVELAAFKWLVRAGLLQVETTSDSAGHLADQPDWQGSL